MPPKELSKIPTLVFLAQANVHSLSYTEQKPQKVFLTQVPLLAVRIPLLLAICLLALAPPRLTNGKRGDSGYGEFCQCLRVSSTKDRSEKATGQRLTFPIPNPSFYLYYCSTFVPLSLDIRLHDSHLLFHIDQFILHFVFQPLVSIFTT